MDTALDLTASGITTAGLGAAVGRALAFAALAGLTFAPLERAFAARAPAPERRRPGTGADLAFASAGQVLVQVGLALGVGWALAWLDVVAAEGPPWATTSLPGWARVALNLAVGLALFDLGGYAYHRLAHRVPWMWRLHEVHHSSQRMDWLASFRQHPLEILLLTLAQNAPLVLAGLPLGAHAAVLVLLRLHTVFVHANIRLPAGRWRLALATPAFHHRHHHRAGPARNFASLFPLVDLAFGTHGGDDDGGGDDGARGRFGLDREMPRTFLGLLLHPLRARAAANQSISTSKGSRASIPSPEPKR